MSTTSNVTATNPFADLAAQLFKRVDTNNDGKLSTDEFRSFLEGLLSKADTTKAAPASSAAPAPTPKAAGGTAAGYRPMVGFDFGKLNNPAHVTQKYVFARATQDIDLPFDRASRSAGLARIADYLKANGHPDVVVVGDDKLNFGGGTPDIDVLTGDGQWWWGPTA